MATQGEVLGGLIALQFVARTAVVLLLVPSGGAAPLVPPFVVLRLALCGDRS